MTGPTWGGNCVLLLETSEEMPVAEAWNLQHHTTLEQRHRCREEQHKAIRRVLDTYHPTAMAVFDVDIGHTDPQWIVRYGGMTTVDGPARRISVQY